ASHTSISTTGHPSVIGSWMPYREPVMWPTVEGNRRASVDSSFNQSTKLRISASMVLCVCSTPLALLVVPEVYKINFTLFGSGRFNGTFAGSRTNCSNDDSEES